MPKGLSKVLTSIGNAVEGISDLLSKGSGTKKETGTTNTFGDSQLEVDILADDVCFRELKQCVAVCMASSEETSEEVFCSGRGYSVAFDPLDGSSIIDANWAVGSIFGVYPDPSQKGFIGRRGRDQVTVDPSTTQHLCRHVVQQVKKTPKPSSSPIPTAANSLTTCSLS